MRRVLVVNDDDSARQTLQVKLRSEGYETIGVPSIEGARRALADDPFDLVLISSALLGDVAPSGANGGADAGAGGIVGGIVGGILVGILGPDRGRAAPVVIAIVPAAGGDAAGLVSIGEGAHDFVSEGEGLVGAATVAFLKAEARAAHLAAAGAPARVRRTDGTAGLPSPSPSPIIGSSPPMQALSAAIGKVAPFKATVLVQGESGTGKELIARAVHDRSPRADGPFVAVNCGAIPAGLMESELFGHCKGAFTDALRDRVGLMEQASGGTLFLDEIAELPLALQVKLLRVLHDDRLRRLGDSEERPIDVRLVAATARDLEGEVAAGRFREDLFHRINVVALRVPPLREREGDIPQLVEHFVRRINQRLRLQVGGVAREAMRVLGAYPWPGNVRELENTVERAAVMCEESEIDVASLPERILHGRNGVGVGAVPGGTSATRPTSASAGGDLSIKRAARRAEEDLIRQALARTGGNRTRAAELLEISHRALLYKIKEYGVSLPMSSGGSSSTAKDAKF